MAPHTVQVNSFAWNKKLLKYVKCGQPEKVMLLFQQMQQQRMTPDKFTFVQVISQCAGLGALEDGRQVNEQIIQSGCESDVFVGNSLVEMYAKCGIIRMLEECLTRCNLKNVFSCTAMILGLVKCGQGQKAL